MSWPHQYSGLQTQFWEYLKCLFRVETCTETGEEQQYNEESQEGSCSKGGFFGLCQMVARRGPLQGIPTIMHAQHNMSF